VILAVRPSNVNRGRPRSAARAGALRPLAWRAGLAVVLATGVLVAGGCSPPLRCPPGAQCPAAVPRVTFTLAVTGQAAASRRNSQLPGYRVHPGEYLMMRIRVTVPLHVTVTGLWLGLSAGRWGDGRNGPAGMNRILAHYTQPLPAGSHTFGLRWRTASRRALAAARYLTYTWSSHQPPASVSGPVAQLVPE